jgi:hypothetical protein
LGTAKSVVIPSTVREIEEHAFESVESLQDLSFEEGVEQINSLAFCGCYGLKAVSFPAALVAIGDHALSCSPHLGEVAFAEIEVDRQVRVSIAGTERGLPSCEGR